MRVIVADSALNPGEPAYASSFVITSVPVLLTLNAADAVLVAGDVPGGFGAVLDHADSRGALEVVTLEADRGTPFNLLGMDEWVRRFTFINYIDCFDGRPVASHRHRPSWRTYRSTPLTPVAGMWGMAKDLEYS